MLSQLTGLPTIVVSNATVFFVHEDVQIDDVEFKDLLCRLLGLVQRENDMNVRMFLNICAVERREIGESGGRRGRKRRGRGRAWRRSGPRLIE